MNGQHNKKEGILFRHLPLYLTEINLTLCILNSRRIPFSAQSTASLQIRKKKIGLRLGCNSVRMPIHNRLRCPIVQLVL